MQSRMDNPETLVALDTQDEDKKTQHSQKTKKMSNTDPPKIRDEPRCL